MWRRGLSKVGRHDDAASGKARDTGVEDSEQTIGEQIEAASVASSALSRNYYRFRPGEGLVPLIEDVEEVIGICVSSPGLFWGLYDYGDIIRIKNNSVA